MGERKLNASIVCLHLSEKNLTFKMNENLCRICLTSDESKLLEIFGADHQAEYATKVIFCTGIEVHRVTFSLN